ncbi:Proteasome assembly chaperone 2, partial [Termitomyces sp. J132]
PVVSTANVSQLAVDLLIASFSLQRLAIINPEFLVPVVGGREGDGEGITTAAELYGAPEMNILVIQQRSPVLKSRKEDFVSNLLEFIEKSGIVSVLFLSGVDLSNRTDTQMFTPTYQLQPRNGPSLSGTALDALTTLPIATYTSPVLQSPHESVQEIGVPFIPGGGLTRRILASLPKNWNIPTASLLQFVLEGDNRADARLFAAVAAKVIGQDVLEWQQPNTWNVGLFGAPHDQTLYG